MIHVVVDQSWRQQGELTFESDTEGYTQNMYRFVCTQGLPWWCSGKESACQCRRRRSAGSVLGWEGPLEKGMAIRSSILAWEIPWEEEPGGLQSRGAQRVGHDCVTERTHIRIHRLLCTSMCPRGLTGTTPPSKEHSQRPVCDL